MPPPTEPTLFDRVQGAAARALGQLPPAVQTRLAGGPHTVDGQTFDPAFRLILLAHRRQDPAATIRTDAAQARAMLRRDVLAVRGQPTPVASVRDLEVDGADGPLAARLYRPEAERPPLVVYFHGGGFVEGDLDTHDEPCRLLCRHAEHAVLSVAYRLAPEHPFPAAADDAVAAFRWAQREAASLGTSGVVTVGGDSAGGTLAAVVAQATRDDDPPAAQLLLYPATDHPVAYPSRSLFDGYLLSEAMRRAFFDVYTGGTDTRDDDPRLSPIYGRLDRLAPALVVTAGFDVLRDEGEAYARALQAAGTPTALYRQPTLPHGFVQATAASPAALQASVALARRWRAVVADLASTA